MKGIIAGSIICFLAFLSVIRTQDVVNSPDLVQDALPEETVSQPNDQRSGNPSDDDPDANANDDDDDDADQQYGLDAERSGVSAAHAQAHAESSSGGRNEYPGYNPYYPGSSYPSPYGTGSSSASAQAQALSGGGSTGGQGLNRYSPGSLYPASPYSSGSNSALAQALAQASSGGGSPSGQAVNPGLSPYSPGSLYPSPYGSGSSSASAQALAEAFSGGQGGQGSNTGLNPYLPGSFYPSRSSSSQAQAEAISGGGQNGQALNPSFNPYSPEYFYPGSPYDSGSSSASAQALADISSGDSPRGQEVYPGLNTYLPGSLYPVSPSGSGSSSAQAQAEAISEGIQNGQGLSPKFNSYSPGSLNPRSPYNLGSSSASAQANAEAINEGIQNGQGLSPKFNPYSPGSLNSISPYNSGSSSASAQAIAEVSNDLRRQGVNPSLNSYLPGSLSPASPSGSELSSAEAQAEAISGGSKNGQNSASAQAQAEAISGESKNGQVQNSALAQAQADVSNGDENLPDSPESLSPDPLSDSGSRSAQAVAEASSEDRSLNSGSNAHAEAIARAASTGHLNYRVIPQYEYILPYNVPGAERVVVCSRVGELHYIWTNLECFVCACIINSGSTALRPVCASCSGCLDPDPVPVTVPPPPPPAPIPIPLPTPPPLPPPPQVTCSPLPSGVPFQNPLHPCQICICTESITVYGQPDVQIECQENPQCVVPPDVTTLPPFPDDKPIPLPLCKKFPQNVFFPYPADPCKLCKCSVSLSEYGIPEEQISCYPNPACEPQPFTLPPSAINPVTEPYIIIIPTQQPATNPAPPAPGPLPGPSPHESCRPYQPNQPFQHPWDECQLCICTESYSVGLITIEVNCYNKKTCCLDLDPVTPSPLPYGGLIGSAESHASAIAQSNSNLIPSGNFLPGGGMSQNQASAEATAISQSNQPEYILGPQGNQIRPGLVPETVFVPLGHRHKPGENHLDDIFGLPGHRPGGSQQSIAEAIASAQSQLGGDNGQPEYIIEPQRHLHRPGDNHPEHGLVPQGIQLRPGVSQSTAEAIASAQSQINQGLQPGQVLGQYGNQIRPGGQIVPQNRPGGGQYQIPGMSSAEAEALASAQVGYNNNPPSYYQGYNPPGYGGGYSNYPPYYTGYSSNRGLPGYAPRSSSSAEAVANANGDSSNANAEALASSQGSSQAAASANAQSGLSGGNNYEYMPPDNAGYNSAGIPASLLYSDLYSRPSYEITPLYQPGRGFGSSSNAVAQAQAQGGSNAQAQASAVSGGRTKSGNPEDDATDEQDRKRR